jgi:hypothetical protein
LSIFRVCYAVVGNVLMDAIEAAKSGQRIRQKMTLLSLSNVAAVQVDQCGNL